MRPPLGSLPMEPGATQASRKLIHCFAGNTLGFRVVVAGTWTVRVTYGRGGVRTVAELWNLGNEQWSRDAEGRFQVNSFCGLGPASPAWSRADLGRLVGARFDGAAEIFPAEFARSPLTGAPLAPAALPEVCTWLPPYGEKDTSALATIGWLGLPRTCQRLVLDLNHYPPESSQPLASDVGLPPADILPLPGAGSYFFVVERFGCKAATLLAIEYSRGLLFAWAVGARKWVELTAAGGAIPECSLQRDLWGVQLTSVQNGAPALVMPTDAGLVVVSIDILALTYSIAMIAGRCVGAPLLIGESIAAPVVAAGDILQLVVLDRKQPTEFKRTAIPNNLLKPGCRFNRGFSDRRMAVWLADTGQLLYRPEAVDQNRLLTVPWPERVAPCFEFGAPYLSTTGRLWLLTRNAGAAAYEYHLLGQSSPEIQPIRSPKLSTGGTVFHLETQLRGEPWLEHETDDTGAKELLIPLLESVPSRSVLRARVEGVGGMSTAAVLRSRDRYRIVFELEGLRDAQGNGKKDAQASTARFHVTQISQPWLTQPVLHEGRLYLYHPGMTAGIPGWTLQG